MQTLTPHIIRFVDRDMFMRFRGGGIGHKYMRAVEKVYENMSRKRIHHKESKRAPLDKDTLDVCDESGSDNEHEPDASTSSRTNKGEGVIRMETARVKKMEMEINMETKKTKEERVGMWKARMKKAKTKTATTTKTKRPGQTRIHPRTTQTTWPQMTITSPAGLGVFRRPNGICSGEWGI